MTMGFHTLPFEKRLELMGDASEQALAAHFPGKVEPFGWNRPNVTMARMAATIRHQPDAYLDTPEGGYLVECVGCGRDGKVKFRSDKIEALALWQTIQPVRIWAWRSTTKLGYLVEWADFRKLWWAAAHANGVLAFAVDNNLYVEVPHADLAAVAL